MADTRVTPQKMTRAGVVPSYSAAIVAATTDYVMKNDGRTFIYVKNAGGSPDVVTFKTPAQIRGLDITDPTVSVTNGTEQAIGPFEPSLFNDANGDMRFNHSFITTVTVAHISM